ncbi:cytochrome c oxidase subunit 6C-1 [Palaemon carinicauda]|uniref:cytochrome c oxidase subunit 6C-1 n=1 Tax=Palaemon carinicauda TaxID=392227 RepID=UPI0035B68A69
MSAAKPLMRGLLTNQIKRNLAISGVLCVLTFTGYKYGVEKPRQQRYADFYKNYDAEKEFERMRNLGLFQSCQPDEE